MDKTPWAAFCMSTYRRPLYLESQLRSLLTQTFRDFEIVISDNDPAASGEEVARSFNDPRVRYFNNGTNLGMISSFNKSIERSSAEFIVMVTDDDPVVPHFLSDMKDLYHSNNGYVLYAGFSRKHLAPGAKEVITSENFLREILHPVRTPWFLWSSCMMKRDVLLKIGGIPDYGSPHLADHALIAMAGSRGGGVIVNNQYSSLTSHDSNFSKVNFQYYVNGCKGFYEHMSKFCAENKVSPDTMRVVRLHLHYWLIGNVFNLKRYYTATAPDPAMVSKIRTFAESILEYDFMKGARGRYRVKNFIFHIKSTLGLLKK